MFLRKIPPFILILFLCGTDLLVAQRRFVENDHGLSFGIGRAFAQGSGGTSQGIDLSTGFTKGAEFIFSAGRVSADHASTGYVAVGAELYGDNIITPVVDVSYIRYANKKDFGKDGIAIAFGLSYLAVNSKEVVFGPEIGLGTSLSLDKMNSTGIPRILHVGINAGVRSSAGKMILIYFGTAGEKSLWITSFGLGFLLG